MKKVMLVFGTRPEAKRITDSSLCDGSASSNVGYGIGSVFCYTRL